MQFNNHFRLEGKHSILSASKYHWIRYDDEKMYNSFLNSMEAALGTRLHNLAKEHIELGLKMPKTNQTLNMFINDAIGLHMIPEQILYFSDNSLVLPMPFGSVLLETTKTCFFLESMILKLVRPRPVSIS